MLTNNQDPTTEDVAVALDQHQSDALKKLSAQTGIPPEELIRRCIAFAAPLILEQGPTDQRPPLKDLSSPSPKRPQRGG